MTLRGTNSVHNTLDGFSVLYFEVYKTFKVLSRMWSLRTGKSECDSQIYHYLLPDFGARILGSLSFSLYVVLAVCALQAS